MNINEFIEFMKDVHLTESQKYNGTSEFVFDKTSNKGLTKYDVLHPYGSIGYTPSIISIGIKNLVNNMSESGELKNDDVVWCVWQMLHEIRHDSQRSIDFMSANASNETSYMAEYQIVHDYDEYYGYGDYFTNPTELDAELYALTNLGNICKPYDISVDSFVLNKINTGHNGFVFDYCKSMEDVIGSYEKAFNSSLFSRDYTKECMYIAEHNPEYFRGYQCIRDKYCQKQNVRNRVENFVSKRILHIVPYEFEEIENQSNIEDNQYE